MQHSGHNLLLWRPLAALCVIASVFFYFAFFSPMMSDNFIFSRDIQPDYAQFYTGSPITATMPDIASSFRQAACMYQNWCGRYAGNLAVYLLFLLPHWLYAILASIGFAIYIVLLQICIFGRTWRQNATASWFFAIAGLLWAGIPSFGEAFFWLSVGGEIALIGQAAIFIPYRFVLDGPSPPQAPARIFFKCLCIFIGGLLVASLDYATCAALPPTCIACCFWLYFKNRGTRRKLPAVAVAGALGLCLGAYLTLTAPGNAQRLHLSHDPAVRAYLESAWPDRIWGWLSSLPAAMVLQWIPLIFLGWCCIWLWRENRPGWLRCIPQASLLFLVPAALTHGAYLLTAWPPPRALATSCAQLTVCACILFTGAASHASSNRFWRQFGLLRVVLCLLCVVSIGHESINFYQVDAIIKKREQILSSGADAPHVPPLPPGSGDKYQVLGKYQPDISADPSFWVNRAVAAYYGVKQVSVRRPHITYSISPDIGGQGSVLKITFADDRLEISAPMSEVPYDSAMAHIYYFGANSLLHWLPHFLGQKIFHWLAAGSPESWRKFLVPLLLARTDIALRASTAEELAGASPHLKMLDASHVWLVRPWQERYSFDVMPLVGFEFAHPPDR